MTATSRIPPIGFITSRSFGPVLLWLIAFVAAPLMVSAQNFGGVPPEDSWMIRKGDHVDIIFSNEVAPLADSVASIIEQINRTDPYSLGASRKDIPIILRNKNLTTNGFVGYVPFRSEFFLFGAQNPNVLGFHDWMELLTLHEYRHVIQYSNLNRGITRLTGQILGHAAQAGIYNLLVPNWFSEGDAVLFESAMTGNGRGQLPSFLAPFRALLLENKKYTYHKYRNGSFKDLVPNHYVHGYLLTGYGYQEYGQEFWPHILDQTARLKGLVLPFRQAIRQETGFKLPDYHDAMLDDYQKSLAEQVDTNLQMAAPYLPQDENIKDEVQILTDDAGRMYLLESSYDEISTVYQLSGNEKKKLFTLGRTFDPYLILRGSRLLFTNRGLNSRWTNREYSDIYAFDLDRAEMKRITKHQKYLSVDYLPAANRYLAVQAGEDGKTVIVTFDENHDIVDTLIDETNTYLAYPRWVDTTANRFIFTRRKNGHMSLALHQISTRSTVDLVGPVRETIARPFPTAEGIFYSSSKTGIDNIYFFDYRTRQQTSVTADLTGAYNPTVSLSSHPNDTPRLYYSSTTAHGHRIRSQKMETGELRSQSATMVPGMTPIYAQFPIRAEQLKSGPNEDPAHPERYKPGQHLLNFHSLYLEPSLTTPRLSLLSNDYLNTTRASIYTLYRDADRSWEAGGEMTYAGWFPEITLGVNHRFNRRLNLRLDNERIELPKSETSADIGLAVPLNFSRRQVGHFLRIGGKYGWTQEHFDPNDPVLPGPIDLAPRTFQTAQFASDWSLLRQRAYRDIFPKWGVTSTLKAKRSFSPGKSWMVYAGQNLYLPGLFSNDGFKFRWQAQFNSLSANNLLPFELNSTHDVPYNFPTFRSGVILTANYLFPLAYPEISIPHVIYTKRVAVNLFTEHFRSEAIDDTWAGIDVFLTAQYFNLFEFTAGVRVSRQMGLTSAPYAWSLIFLEDL